MARGRKVRGPRTCGAQLPNQAHVRRGQCQRRHASRSVTRLRRHEPGLFDLRHRFSTSGAPAPREESLTCYPCPRNSHSKISVPTGIRRVVCEHNAISQARGFVPIRVERSRDAMCLKLGGGRPSPEGRWRPHGVMRKVGSGSPPHPSSALPRRISCVPTKYTTRFSEIAV